MSETYDFSGIAEQYDDYLRLGRELSNHTSGTYANNDQISVVTDYTTSWDEHSRETDSNEYQDDPGFSRIMVTQQGPLLPYPHPLRKLHIKFRPTEYSSVSNFTILNRQNPVPNSELPHVTVGYEKAEFTVSEEDQLPVKAFVDTGKTTPDLVLVGDTHNKHSTNALLECLDASGPTDFWERLTARLVLAGGVEEVAISDKVTTVEARNIWFRKRAAVAQSYRKDTTNKRELELTEAGPAGEIKTSFDIEELVREFDAETATTPDAIPELYLVSRLYNGRDLHQGVGENTGFPLATYGELTQNWIDQRYHVLGEFLTRAAIHDKTEAPNA